MDSLEGMIGAWIGENHGTKKALAKAIGCTPETLNKKLNGKSKITIIDARLLADAMGGDTENRFNEICRLAPM